MTVPLFNESEWTFGALDRAFKAVEEIALGEMGLEVYPNQVEIISTEQMLDAYSALGMRSGQGLRLVVIPQAMRIIIPPLTSQYLNLTKNSSLAVAIGYPDLYAIGGTILNQTGQAIEVVVIFGIVYLGISILTSILMNWFNAKMALKER